MPLTSSVALASSTELQNSTHSTVRGNSSGRSTAAIGIAMLMSGEKMPLATQTPSTIRNIV